MRGRHVRSRIPRVIGRLRTGFNQADPDRDLSDRLDAALRASGRRDIAVIAIHDAAYAEGLADGLGVGWAPVRGGLGGRHLTAVPPIRSTG